MDKVSIRKIEKSLALFAVVIVLGVTGFVVIEGWSILDAFYMTVITLATVGFGEILPLSEAGKLFTIVLIIIGLGSAATVLNILASALLDNKLNSFLGRKGMQSELKKISNHVILCGFGQIGNIISLKLHEKDIPFVIIDSNDEAVKKARQLGFITFEGNITSDATLLTAGIKRASTIVVCTSDVTINLTLSLAARELNPGIKVIARGVDRSLESRITRAGADIVVYPMSLGGEQISRIITGNYDQSIESINTALQPIDGYYLKVHKHFRSETTTIKEVLKKEKGLRAIGYKPKSATVIDDPDPETIIHPGDSVIILLNNELSPGENEFIERQKIEWSDDYSIGIGSIDEEHLHLINLINEFNEALVNGKAKSVIAKVFDSLVDYTVLHFNHEEQILREANYPELEQHIAEHRELAKKVMDLNKERNYIFPNNISEFLNMWLIEHILGSDKKYQSTLLSRKKLN